MVRRAVGQVPCAFLLVALAAFAASGRGLAWAHAARNETAASANGETLNALLSTTSRAFSRDACIESIRIMKSAYRDSASAYPEINVSVPPDNSFIPPGAQEWCDCLYNNEPTGGIPSDYEGVFETCRVQVLVNSDFNAMDICRGMVKMYGYSFWRTYTTFCSRELCEARDEFGSYQITYKGGYDYGFDAFTLSGTCSGRGARCLPDLSAGYCAKYRLTYGGWVRRDGFTSTQRIRFIAVDSSQAGSQQQRFRDWGPVKGFVADNICNRLYPNDKGQCCTYERGYATLSQCCYEKDGALEFNCALSYGGDRLRYNCMKLGEKCYYRFGSCYSANLYNACSVLIDYYVAHPTYQQATLAELPNGQTSVVFPEAFMDDFCDSTEWMNVIVPGQDAYTPGTREYCCFKMNTLFRNLVENCLVGSGTYEPLGATRLPPFAATPQPTPSPSCDPCSDLDEQGVCQSVCKNGQECTVRKGKAVCVRCNFFRQDFPDGKNRQCCQLRSGDSGTPCQTKVDNKGEKIRCFTNEGPWTTNMGVPRDPQPYTIEAVKDVCYGRDNFWVNRMLCKVQPKANGKKKCKFISKSKRESILAGR